MPDFIILKYKIWEIIFQIAIFNLYYNSKIGDKSLYKKFYFIYIQLSYLQILNKILLLQFIILKNINSKLYIKF